VKDDPNIDLYSVINRTIAYFINEEEWAPVYAYQVIIHQSTVEGLTCVRKRNSPEVVFMPSQASLESDVELILERYTISDGYRLVDRICDTLFTFMRKKDHERLKRELRRMVRRSVIE